MQNSLIYPRPAKKVSDFFPYERILPDQIGDCMFP